MIRWSTSSSRNPQSSLVRCIFDDIHTSGISLWFWDCSMQKVSFRPLSQGWTASLTAQHVRGIVSLLKGFLHLIVNPFLCTGLLLWQCMTGALLNSWLILGFPDVDLEQLECLQGEDVLLTNFRGPFLVICRDCRNWGLLIQTSRQLPNCSPQLWLLATHVEV